MAEEITVQLFPPQPVGVQNAAPPMSREPILVPVPCYQYVHVTDVDVDELGRVISFTNRGGERIESNLPFLVKRENKPEGNA